MKDLDLKEKKKLKIFMKYKKEYLNIKQRNIIIKLRQ